MVREFFAKCREDDPERFEEVCSKYPVVSARRINAVKRRESTVGLLGLQPSRIPLRTAIEYDLDSVNMGEDAL
jgi:hypothetical protein